MNAMFASSSKAQAVYCAAKGWLVHSLNLLNVSPINPRLAFFMAALPFISCDLSHFAATPPLVVIEATMP